MKKTGIWIKAVRLRTLPLALACIGLGSFLAAFDEKFRFEVFVLSSLTTLFLQILSNLSNDYGDSVHGADHVDRSGPGRVVQEGLVSKKSMKKAMLLFVVLSLTSGMALITVSLDLSSMVFYIFLLLGVVAILAAIKYTVGKKPYGYAGLGDLFVIIFFGLVGVMGTYFLHTGQVKFTYFLPALSCGFLTTAVLNINNIRDIESDKMAGKKSIPVRIGRKNAVIYHWFLLSAAIISAIVFVFIHYSSPLQFLFLVSLPLIIKNGVGISQHSDSMEIDPYLKQMALTTLIFIVTFGIGILF